MLWLIALPASGIVLSVQSWKQIAWSCIIESLMTEDMSSLKASGFPVSLTDQAGVCMWELGILLAEPPNNTTQTAELTSLPTEEFRRLHVDCFHALVLPSLSLTHTRHIPPPFASTFLLVRLIFYFTPFLLNLFSCCACLNEWHFFTSSYTNKQSISQTRT